MTVLRRQKFKHSHLSECRDIDPTDEEPLAIGPCAECYALDIEEDERICFRRDKADDYALGEKP